MPDEAREVGDADQARRERVDREHRARRQAPRPPVLDDRHPRARRSQFRLEAQFLHQPERVAIGAGDQLRAALNQVSITGLGADSAADAASRLEHPHINPGLPEPKRRSETGHPCADDDYFFVRHRMLARTWQTIVIGGQLVSSSSIVSSYDKRTSSFVGEVHDRYAEPAALAFNEVPRDRRIYEIRHQSYIRES